MGTLARRRELAVVTGASSGLGFELATELAEHGFDLVIAANSAKIETAARELAGTGAIVDAVQVDLATPEGVEELYGHLTATGRPVEAIAINAAIGVRGDSGRRMSLDDELYLLRLNVLSVVHLAKLVARDMAARGSGRILFASTVCVPPSPLEAVYDATKAFVVSFAASLHDELEDKGVLVSALMPDARDPSTLRGGATDDARRGFEALMTGDARVAAAATLKARIEDAAARFFKTRARRLASRTARLVGFN